jgi:hypothetical protein
MRHQFTTVLPFLADELAAKAGIEIIPCTCPAGGPCLGLEDEPVATILIFTADSDEDDNEGGPSGLLDDPEDLDDDLDNDEDDNFEFQLTPEGIAEIEREQDRQEVSHLGKVVDNMVYITGMYAALVQNKVGA